jgi:hypothetical protein
MSRLLELARTAATQARGPAVATPAGARESPPPAPARGERLRRCGDLAEAIHAHCQECAVCRAESYTSDDPARFCGAGRQLWRCYREARRSNLRADSN